VYGCHVVAVGGGEAGASARGEEEGKTGRAAEREAAGPAAPAPFSFFFLNFFFPKELKYGF